MTPRASGAAFGCAGIVADRRLSTPAWSSALAAKRQRDVRALVAISLLAAAVDATAGLLPLSGLVEDAADGAAQLIAICLVVLVLTTVLPPILRRLQPRAETAPAPRPDPPSASPARWWRSRTGSTLLDAARACEPRRYAAKPRRYGASQGASRTSGMGAGKARGLRSSDC